MIDLSTKVFFNTVRIFIDHRPIARRRRKRTTEVSAGQVDGMAEQANKRKQPDHQKFENNSSKRQKKKHKLRVHPKEAGHSIEDLPSIAYKTTESDKLSAAETLKSLGLGVNGAGKSAEVWFVGASEQTEDGGGDAEMSEEAKWTSFDVSAHDRTM